MLTLVPPLPNASAVATDTDGTAVLQLPALRDFVVRGRLAPRYQDLFIVGRAGRTRFNYTTYMGTRLEAAALARLIGVPYNTSRGYIVIGLDRLRDPSAGLAPSNLLPAVGSSAVVTGINGSAPFVFAGGLWPMRGRTISPTSSSFVTFPGMAAASPGFASAVPPVGQVCEVSPAMTEGTDAQAVRAYPDAVTVVSFVCRNRTAVPRVSVLAE